MTLFLAVDRVGRALDRIRESQFVKIVFSQYIYIFHFKSGVIVIGRFYISLQVIFDFVVVFSIELEQSTCV